ncbi:MAG: hypothetical protein L3J03_05865 [Desulfobacterales bacterium]|nr:hypothetical protein [Desulfobacterales bacterium]
MFRKYQWYSWALRLAVFFAVFWVIGRNIGEIRRYDFSCDWRLLFFSFVSLTIGYLAIVRVWIGLTGEFGIRVPFAKAAKAWFVSQLGKYVPGKVVLLLVRFDVYQGYPKRTIVIATWIEYVVSLVASGMLILLALAAAPQLVPPTVRWLAGIGTLLFMGLLWPPWLARYVNWGLVALGKDTIDEFPSYPALLRFVGGFVFVGLLHGLGLFLTIRSFFAVDFSYFLIIAGVYEAAALIGLAAVFAPSGLGVREGVLFLVLPLFLPLPVVIVSSILIRLITTGVELLLSCLFLGLDKYSGTSGRPVYSQHG